jgi:hypothetical protein
MSRPQNRLFSIYIALFIDETVILCIQSHQIYRGRNGMVDLQLPMQSVPVTTNIVSSNPAQVKCTQYNIMW